MRWSDFAAESLAGVSRHLRSSVLAAAGVAWGLAAFLVLMAYGNGLAEALVASQESVGKGLVVVSPGQTSQQAGGERAGRPVLLRREDIAYLRTQGLPARGIAGETSGRFLYRGPLASLARAGLGVEAEYGVIRNVLLEEGRFLTALDVDERRRVVILGGAIKARLFGSQSAVGRLVQVDGQPYQVVGVVARRAQILLHNGRDDEKAYFPWTTFQQLHGGERLNHIVLSADGSTGDDELIARLRAALARKRGFSPSDTRALRIVAFNERLRALGGTVVGLQWLLALVGVLTLAIGGVGVANTMFILVRARTREIGLRQALGARRRWVLAQLVTEALLLCLTGGLAGAALAIAVVALTPPLRFLSVFTNAVDGARDLQISRNGDIVLSLDLPSLVAALAVLLVTGLVAGYWPARRAAATDPAICLRYE